jgi:hypothetical protein
MIIRRFPFDPLGGLVLPRGGLTEPQGGYLNTPLIRPLTTSQNKTVEEKPKQKDEDK